MAPPNERKINEMSETAKRITARMASLGTNASAVALQAGLGRSSVRDIISGKAQNPRIDTLQKLTVPLKCSIEYLTGDSADLGSHEAKTNRSAQLELHLIDAAEILELGVFRAPRVGPDGEPIAWQRKLDPPQPMVSGDPRYHGYGWMLYQIDDESLIGKSILKGDFLTVAEPFAEIAPLNPGDIVIVRRRIGRNPAEELSARVVSLVDGHIALITASNCQVTDPIVLRDTLSDAASREEQNFLNLYFVEDGTVSIEGIVVRVARQF
jgi:transcriptional regulator with XRE-family HTH domain